MIFPERVFGRASAKRMSSGVATGPMTVRDVLLQLRRRVRVLA